MRHGVYCHLQVGRRGLLHEVSRRTLRQHRLTLSSPLAVGTHEPGVPLRLAPPRLA